MKLFNYLLAISRLFLFILITVFFYSWLLGSNLFIANRLDKLKRGIIIRRFIIKILHTVLGIKIISYGKLPKTSGLIISNHRSYFDSLVILKNVLAYPIAKIELASWPLIGNVAKTTGAIFVNRESKESRVNTLKEVRKILKNGYSILNTPEGTTHGEPTTIIFKPGAFKIAAQYKIQVVPVAIDYKNKYDYWLGNDSFLPHFLVCFGKWRTEIKVSYLESICSDNVNELITKSKQEIDIELLRFRADWDKNIG